jgi:hypothetical protein
VGTRESVWSVGRRAIERPRRALARSRPARDTEAVSDELTWDQRILRLIEPGIDVTQLDRNLKLTPTERLEQMDAMLRDLEEMRGTPRADRSAPR